MTNGIPEDYLTVLKLVSEMAIIAYTDINGRITFANNKFCEISGYSLEELKGQDHKILNSHYHDKSFFQNMYRTIKSGNVWRGEVKNKRKDGSFYWVDSKVFPIYDSQNHFCGFGSIRFDITERKNMEESLLRLEKLASLGEMSAVVAHEINNPLTVIDLSSKAISNDLERGIFEKERVMDKVEKIHKSVIQISKIIGGLKTFSRKGEHEQYSQISLKTFLEEALSFSQAKCKQKEILFKIPEIPPVHFDCRPDQISQVLLNLLNNAQDAVENIPEKWIELKLNIDEKNNLMKLQIVDSGKGIEEKLLAKIKNPFFTTKEVGKGTGLGLSISSAIASEHNGKLYYETTNTNNTSFVLEIPLIQNARLNRQPA